ncbi:MAG: aminotransferase class III-fold pyridoxal phosphate-dependent enzyme, partial [Gemmataceae bacterium]|nr:aminotransferase class III-fold pyridoxal phosphate-dependent enzyme [Gemmataceae bacterium]
LLKEGMIDNAAVRGEQLRRGLAQLQSAQPNLGEMRGLGLMTAVEVVHSDTRAPNPVLRDALIQAAFQEGLLLLGCGESALRFCPPLCISAEQVETALVLLGKVLSGQNATSNDFASYSPHEGSVANG